MRKKDTLFFSEDKKDKKILKEQLTKTFKSLYKVFNTQKCYNGAKPAVVNAAVSSIDILPDDGVGFDEALKTLEEKVYPYMVYPPSKNYMAHLHSPVLIESLSSELILNTFNQSMDSWDQGPASTNVEEEVVHTLCSLFGYEEGDGALTSGGSQSNLTATFLARDAKLEALGFDARNNPLGEWSEKLVCYVSEISHFSFDKAAHLLGLSYKNVRHVVVDDKYRMDMDELEALIKEDIEAGLVPFLVVATVGTTDFGSIDPLSEISTICRKYEMYMHADAAYGSALIMSDEYKSRIQGIDKADSITVDFHKMFLLPISCSCLLVKDKNYLNPLSFHAVYLNREEEESDGYTNLVSKGLQTTRRFDALKVLFSFLVRGKKGFNEIVNKNIENAKYFYNILKRDRAFEVLNNPEISAVVFRVVYKKKGIKHHNRNIDANALNKNIRHNLMHEKGIFIGETEVNGHTYLKTTILNPRLEKSDFDRLKKTIIQTSFSL